MGEQNIERQKEAEGKDGNVRNTQKSVRQKESYRVIPKTVRRSDQLFQIATVSFAYSASLQRKQSKFMGIRKGILG